MQSVSQDSLPSLLRRQPYWNNTIREHVPMQAATSAVVHALELWRSHVDGNGSK